MQIIPGERYAKNYKLKCKECGEYFYGNSKRKLCDNCALRSKTVRIKYMKKKPNTNEGKSYEGYLEERRLDPILKSDYNK